MSKTEINKADWVVRIVTFRTSASEIGMQYPGKEPVTVGHRQAAKVLLQHAAANCLIYTEEFEPGVVGIYVYEKEKNA